MKGSELLFEEVRSSGLPLSLRNWGSGLVDERVGVIERDA